MRTRHRGLIPSDAQCLNHRLRDFAPGVLLLTGDEAPVTNDEGLEESALHIVRTALAQPRR